MSPRERLNAAERREAILEASLKLFAEQGYHGVTTREIAQAAGVSEALLYRHFRGKDDLYAALENSCLDLVIRVADRLAALEPSTSTLVLAVYFMTVEIAAGRMTGTRQVYTSRLILGSLLGDGRFARGFMEKSFGPYVPKLVASLEAASKAGDLTGPVNVARTRVWLTHHLVMGLGWMSLPTTPVADIGAEREEVQTEAVRFALRGLGLRPEAIDRHFNAQALGLLIQTLARGDVPPRSGPSRSPRR